MLSYLFLAALGLHSVCGLSLVAASGGCSPLPCPGFSLWWLLLWLLGSRAFGLQWLRHRLSCSMACGIFLDQGLNPCVLHWQADSWGCPMNLLKIIIYFDFFQGKKVKKYSDATHTISLKKVFLFIYLYYLFLAVLGLCGHASFSLVAASRGYSSLQCTGFSSWWFLLFQSMDSMLVAYGLSCFLACGISQIRD